MSLTSKALDRLLARVVDRLADRVPAQAFPVHPADLTAALDRAADRVTRERFATYLDDGSFDHRVNDSLDSIIERRVDDSTKDLERRIEREIENVDVEDLVRDKIDDADFDVDTLIREQIDSQLPDLEDLAREQIVETLGEVDPAELMRTHAEEFVEAALVSRFGLPVGDVANAQARAAAEIISTTVCRLEDAVNATLEGEVQP